jgi:hypothetical protein
VTHSRVGSSESPETASVIKPTLTNASETVAVEQTDIIWIVLELK